MDAGAPELAKECKLYLAVFTGTIVGYQWIVSSLLPAAESLVFFMVLPGNQVSIVHSLGRFICVLGRPKAAHNCIFGLLVEKVGFSLPPISMVTASGLVL